MEDLVEKNAKLNRKLSNKHIVRICKDVVRGLNWLHHKGIIHRDLKTANLLIDANNKVRLTQTDA